jgi:TPR repeat protein
LTTKRCLTAVIPNIANYCAVNQGCVKMGASSLQDLNRDQERAYSLLNERDYPGSRRIFEDLLEQGVAGAEVYLGYIFSRTENPEYDLDKAISYYTIAAENKDTYAQYALGALLEKLGNRDEALKWYCEGSNLDHATCSYLAFREFSKRGDAEASEEFFRKALEQGSPAAIQRRAIQRMGGRFGWAAILPGLFQYIGNMPRMARFIKNEVSRK